jgi:hypothetical protein
MTGLLLDHPWRLDDALDPGSGGFRVLERFVGLIRETGLEVVPFITRTEYDRIWQRIEYSRVARTRGYASLVSFAEHLVRDDSPGPAATPVPEPPQLTTDWKRGLREALGDLRDWRTPHIVVAENRRPQWPGTREVAIQLEDLLQLGPQHRVLASLDGYASHPFAISDLDPWDLQAVHPPIAGADRQHPCYLPKPPMLQNVPMHGIGKILVEVRSTGWHLGGRYYFIPAEDCKLEAVDKPTWRGGRAFRHGYAPERNHPGPVDYAGRVWVWDRAERHWDVQLVPRHIRVGHTGDPL